MGPGANEPAGDGTTNADRGEKIWGALWCAEALEENHDFVLKFIEVVKLNEGLQDHVLHYNYRITNKSDVNDNCDNKIVLT